jgi:hypothetical protein
VTENSNGSAYYPVGFNYCDNYLEVSGNNLELKPATYTYGLRIYYCDGTTGLQGRIFNNNISITTGTGTSYGMYIYNSNYQNIGFNNVNLTAGGNSARAIYMYNGGNNRLANNNFVTTVTAYTIYYTGSGLSYSDYNNYYTTASQFAYFGGALANLAAWQTSTGLDLNSLSVDPGYYSSTDLHVMNVALNNAGIPFDNVTVDIDGELRNPTTPDIGSDEFNPVPLDLNLMAIVQPALHFSPVGTQIPVEVQVRNLGTDTVSAFTVKYAYAANPVVSQPWSGTLPPGQNVSVQFNTPFQAVVGQNSLKVYLEAMDTLNANDTIHQFFVGVPVVQIAYATGFDQPPYFWYGDGNTSLWEHGAPTAAKINTAHSAPNVWATNLGGQYNPGMTGEYLYSPYFNFSNVQGATLSFWHWREIATSVDGCNLQYSKNGGQTWTNLGFLNDPAGTNWYSEQYSGVHVWNGSSAGWVNSTYNLSLFNNEQNPVQFRFHFFSDGSSQDDGFALDDFQILLPQVANDVAVTAILTPVNDTAIGSQVYASVIISNFGTNAQTNIPLELKINGSLTLSETWTGNLASQGSVTYTFVQPYMVPQNAYQLCVATKLAGDAYPSNDATCVSLGVLPAMNDVGITAILAPLPDAIGEICFWDSITHIWYQKDVIVRIKNFGQNTQTAIPISYTFRTGGTVYGDVWIGILAPDSTVDYVLQNLFAPILGAQQVCVETALASDPVANNNKTCKNYIGRTCIGVDDLEGDRLGLLQNIPNPAGNATIIGYNVPQAGKVTFGLVNMVGQMLNTERHEVMAGYHEIQLDAASLSAGVYYYFIEFNGQRLTRKMVVSR